MKRLPPCLCLVRSWTRAAVRRKPTASISLRLQQLFGAAASAQAGVQPGRGGSCILLSVLPSSVFVCVFAWWSLVCFDLAGESASPAAYDAGAGVSTTMLSAVRCPQSAPCFSCPSPFPIANLRRLSVIWATKFSVLRSICLIWSSEENFGWFLHSHYLFSSSMSPALSSRYVELSGSLPLVGYVSVFSY